MTTHDPNASDPMADPDLRDDARRAMRRKALDCLAEADRLDALHLAVAAKPASSPLPDFKPNSDGDPS